MTWSPSTKQMSRGGGRGGGGARRRPPGCAALERRRAQLAARGQGAGVRRAVRGRPGPACGAVCGGRWTGSFWIY